LSKKDYKDKLEEAKFKSVEVLKAIPDLEDSVQKLKKDWWWEGWIDFDVGDPVKPINMYSIKVAGDQRVIASAIEVINQHVVGKPMTRPTVEIVKKLFVKRGIEVLEEKMNRPTAEEEGTV